MNLKLDTILILVFVCCFNGCSKHKLNNNVSLFKGNLAGTILAEATGLQLHEYGIIRCIDPDNDGCEGDDDVTFCKDPSKPLSEVCFPDGVTVPLFNSYKDSWNLGPFADERRFFKAQFNNTSLQDSLVVKGTEVGGMIHFMSVFHNNANSAYNDFGSGQGVAKNVNVEILGSVLKLVSPASGDQVDIYRSDLIGVGASIVIQQNLAGDNILNVIDSVKITNNHSRPIYLEYVRNDTETPLRLINGKSNINRSNTYGINLNSENTNRFFVHNGVGVLIGSDDNNGDGDDSSFLGGDEYIVTLQFGVRIRESLK
jgi:hypothetical protein